MIVYICIPQPSNYDLFSINLLRSLNRGSGSGAVIHTYGTGSGNNLISAPSASAPQSTSSSSTTYVTLYSVPLKSIDQPHVFLNRITSITDSVSVHCHHYSI
jgi:hypothetical protein